MPDIRQKTGFFCMKKIGIYKIKQKYIISVFNNVYIHFYAYNSSLFTLRKRSDIRKIKRDIRPDATPIWHGAKTVTMPKLIDCFLPGLS